MNNSKLKTAYSEHDALRSENARLQERIAELEHLQERNAAAFDRIAGVGRDAIMVCHWFRAASSSARKVVDAAIAEQIARDAYRAFGSTDVDTGLERLRAWNKASITLRTAIQEYRNLKEGTHEK